MRLLGIAGVLLALLVVAWVFRSPILASLSLRLLMVLLCLLLILLTLALTRRSKTP